MTQRVAVIGSGYVGTVVAACLAHVGNAVIGVEVDRAKLAELRAGRVPFYEPDLEELVQSASAAGRLRFTDDFADAMDNSDVVFVCVGTPAGVDNYPDMTAFQGAINNIALHSKHYHVIVTKSTVPIGTGRWIASVMEEATGNAAGEGSLFGVASNPEFLREGCAVKDFLYRDRVVIGSEDERAIDLVTEVYRPILDQSFPEAGNHEVALLRARLATAEMIKYASNAFLATKISFANEVGQLCELVGADVVEVCQGMGLDQRIGSKFLNAGVGWGGSCFGKDLAALVSTAGEFGYRPSILEAAINVNDGQRDMVVSRLLRSLHSLRGARIGVLGLAFKPHTDDLRDSPAVDISRRLLAKGAIVSAYDPMVDHVPGLPQLKIGVDAYAVVQGADAVILVTEWPQFLALDLPRVSELMRGTLFFDGRNCVSPDAVTNAGLQYMGIGKAAPTVMPVDLRQLDQTLAAATASLGSPIDI